MPSGPQAHGLEFWLGIAISTGLLGWICKAVYQKLRGKLVAEKQWRTAMNVARAELDEVKAAISAAFDPASPDGIKACFAGLNDKIDSAVAKLAHAIETVSAKVGILHAMRVIDLDRIDEPVVTFCKELRLVFANKAALRVFGVQSFEELRGHNWKDKIEFNTVERAEVAMRKAAEDFRPCTVNIVVRKTKTNGKSVQMSLEPIISPEHHEFSGFTGLVIDLEARHQRARSQLGASPV